MKKISKKGCYKSVIKYIRREQTTQVSMTVYQLPKSVTRVTLFSSENMSIHYYGNMSARSKKV